MKLKRSTMKRPFRALEFNGLSLTRKQLGIACTRLNGWTYDCVLHGVISEFDFYMLPNYSKDKMVNSKHTVMRDTVHQINEILTEAEKSWAHWNHTLGRSWFSWAFWYFIKRRVF